MAILSLFKVPLQSLCRTHCALTTIALVCALVQDTSFLRLSAVSSCPFHSVFTLYFHAPPVLRTGLRNMPPIMISLNLTLLLSRIIPASPHSIRSVLLYNPHYLKDADKEGKGPFLCSVFSPGVHFYPKRKSLYSCYQFSSIHLMGNYSN